MSRTRKIHPQRHEELAELAELERLYSRGNKLRHAYFFAFLGLFIPSVILYFLLIFFMTENLIENVRMFMFGS